MTNEYSHYFAALNSWLEDARAEVFKLVKGYLEETQGAIESSREDGLKAGDADFDHYVDELQRLKKVDFEHLTYQEAADLVRQSDFPEDMDAVNNVERYTTALKNGGYLPELSTSMEREKKSNCKELSKQLNREAATIINKIIKIISTNMPTDWHDFVYYSDEGTAFFWFSKMSVPAKYYKSFDENITFKQHGMNRNKMFESLNLLGNQLKTVFRKGDAIPWSSVNIYVDRVSKPTVYFDYIDWNQTAFYGHDDYFAQKMLGIMPSEDLEMSAILEYVALVTPTLPEQPKIDLPYKLTFRTK
ncbi:immunity protein YezG family protein [Lactiplantibacillus herbarum]|uniref:immunity protein YezG family protein n=1 Tax=Lactiplantibacillus herbarum TaxID=1670446 RepID=UPI00064EE142|nr:immunity protein YezG family protein [Lactiplantibacillus herbarum]